MNTPNELTLVEQPLLSALQSLGYRVISPDEHPRLRSRPNEVLFRPLLLQALRRLNGFDDRTASAVYNELAGLEDNERWIERLRGRSSRKVAGEETHRTVRLVDFDRPENNDFAVTSQLTVQGQRTRRPDVVVYLNGIPVVVIEAKSPINPQENAWDAIDQIRMYEREIPRLFAPNLFNIATNDITLLYGATGAPSEFWSRWRDPWPRSADDFPDATASGLYALLNPERLLDLLAHFLVFETRDGHTVKKVCRYQQLRAVNKMVDRVVQGQHRAGLIWHTQGSGKSLTMAFAALKLKYHRGIQSERLTNPNLLVLTDRVDLHEQITSTFQACGLPNPTDAHSIERLRELVRPGVRGQTVLSTIFKFHWDDERLKSTRMAERQAALADLEVPGSEHWILLVDECHRTQEKDLGAYLRAILPAAVRFGFTGTPVQKDDLDTFTNFGAPGERYLDKYGIDDAVRDGATVPIFYQGRMTEWQLHDKELDVAFDQWFANEPDDRLEELKRRGVTKGDLARFPERIQLIARDIWTHYQAHVQPDGFKAQIVAVDRRACVLYKQALDGVIAESLQEEGAAPDEARRRAEALSVCVFSPNPKDRERAPELVAHHLTEEQTRAVIDAFKQPDTNPRFLIVCNKLLTGFDAPIEQVMYLDNPLTDHNLLQAIARTNRRYGTTKDHGLIVDYIGVSRKLSDALSAYRQEDVAGAMRDADALADRLKGAHREVMDLLRGVSREGTVKDQVLAVMTHLGTEDRWYIFRSKSDAFLAAYQALTPDPRVLPYQADLKFVAACLPYGRMRFEGREEVDFRGYSEKIRKMLMKHLEVTGLTTICKQRGLDDPAFWKDFDAEEDLETAAVRKLAELKKVTTERAADSPARYKRFSDRVRALIKDFNRGLLQAKELMEANREVAEGVAQEDRAHQGTGLSEHAWSIAAILQEHQPPVSAEGEAGPWTGGEADKPELTALQQAAVQIDALYASDETAPPWWQDKPQLKRELRAQVRRMVRELGLEGWQKAIPLEVEQYAVRHHAKR